MSRNQKQARKRTRSETYRDLERLEQDGKRHPRWLAALRKWSHKDLAQERGEEPPPPDRRRQEDPPD